MARNVSSKFGVSDGLDFSSEQGITNIAIDRLEPYHDHRFTLYQGERLEDMIRSVTVNGILNPIIVRALAGGKYEILSGHNRVYAAGQAGLTDVPAVVKTGLSDQEAEIYVVETNLIQRGFKDLKLSEQAFAVALRYNKLYDERKLKSITEELYYIENGQKMPKEEEAPDEKCSGGTSAGTTRDATAEEYGISAATVARLLRIDKLIDEFKMLVDNENIKVRPAVDISFMTEEQQRLTYNLMVENNIPVIDTKMARKLRDLSATYPNLSSELVAEVLTGADEDMEEAPKDKGEKITLPTATYNRYLGSYSKKEANAIIEKALALYFDRTDNEE